jgi:hypothetical protein
MDSFTTITAFTTQPETSGPVDKDSGGGSGSYCVVAKTAPVEDIVDQDGGSGSGSYCVIA